MHCSNISFDGSFLHGQGLFANIFVFVFSGFVDFLPPLKSSMLLWIRKINSVVYVDELLMTSHQDLSKKDSIFFEQLLKQLLYCSFPLGAPFTLQIGSKVCLPSWNNSDTGMSFIVKDYYINTDTTKHSVTKDGNLIEDMQNMTITSKSSCDSILGDSGSIPSQLLTVDECYGSDTSMLSIFSKKNLKKCDLNNLIDETQGGEPMDLSSPASIFTSTPRKSSVDEGNRQKLLYTSRDHSKDISAIKKNTSHSANGKLSQKFGTWFRVARNTKITLQPVNNMNDDSSEVTKEKETYCKDSAYNSLLKIIQAKLKDFKFRGKIIFACILDFN